MSGGFKSSQTGRQAVLTLPEHGEDIGHSPVEFFLQIGGTVFNEFATLLDRAGFHRHVGDSLRPGSQSFNVVFDLSEVDLTGKQSGKLSSKHVRRVRLLAIWRLCGLF